MTDEDETDPLDEAALAKEHLREHLNHVEEMQGSGIWGLTALVVGLVQKVVLRMATRKMKEKHND